MVQEAVAAAAPMTIVVLVHGRPQTFGLGNKILGNVRAPNTPNQHASPGVWYELVC